MFRFRADLWRPRRESGLPRSLPALDGSHGSCHPPGCDGLPACPNSLTPRATTGISATKPGRIARSIVQGQGFSSPLFAETGPTAWMSPVYPYIVAGVFKVFGVYTTASAVVLLSLNALTSALTCIPIFFIARRTFGKRAAKWAGWGWVFFPYAVYFPVERIWETWLATLLLSLLFLFALHLEDRPERRSIRSGAWLGKLDAFGLLAGLAALTSPAIVSVLPFWADGFAIGLHRRRQAWFRPAVICGVGFHPICVPVVYPQLQHFSSLHPVPRQHGHGLEAGH